jgi:hypothetical protein
MNFFKHRGRRETEKLMVEFGIHAPPTPKVRETKLVSAATHFLSHHLLRHK